MLKPALALAMGLAACAASAQPANDSFTNATVLVGNSGTTSGDNTLATLESCEAAAITTPLYPNDPQTNSVWYQWTAPFSGSLELDTAGSVSELLLSVWATPNGLSTTNTLCNANLINLAADDDGQGPYSQVTITVTAGNTYYISVASYDDGTPGDNVGAYVLNYNSDFPVLPSGAFKFTQTTYTVSQSDSSAPISADANTVAPSIRGARVTVTRPAPAYGRVLVDYTVTDGTPGSVYTNVYTTNYFGTNVITLTQSTDLPPILTFSNSFSTNIVVSNYFQVFNGNSGTYQTVVQTYAATNSAVQIFNVAGAGSSSTGPTPLPFSAIPTNFPYLTNFQLTATVVGGGFNDTFTTNFYGFLVNGVRTRATNNVSNGSTFTNSGTTYTNFAVIYTNTPVTNFFGTNILLAYRTTTVPVYTYSTNILITNLISGVIYSSNSIYTNGLLPPISVLVRGTNWFTNSGVAYTTTIYLNGSNYLNSVGALVNETPSPTNVVPFFNILGTPFITTDSSSNIIITATNIYGYSVSATQIIASGTGITKVTNTLAFANLQMSADIIVGVNPSLGPDSPSIVNIPAKAVVLLSNPRLDTNEDASMIIPPTIATPVAYVSALSPSFSAINGASTGAGTFNFERSTFRTSRNVGSAIISVYRNGGNGQDSASVDYTIDPDYPNYAAISPANIDDPSFVYNLYSPANTFPLQADSDYATPNSDFGPPNGTSFSGTLSWGPFDYNPKQIVIPIINNGQVEFNEDLFIQLHNALPLPTDSDPGAILGEVSTATLTILFDNTYALGGIYPGEQPAGSLDRSWNKDGASDSTPPFLNYPGTTPGLGGTVYAVAEQPDGNAIIAGSFISYDSNPYNRIVRVLNNGYQDPTFQGNSSSLGNNSGANDVIDALALQPNGAIIIGGNFTAFNGFNRHYVARLNSNGSVDTTFNPGLGANGRIWSIALEPSGQIIIGGEFTSYNGTNVNRVARLNPDGTLDASFNPGSGPNDTVNVVAVDSNQRVIIGGGFDTVEGTSSGGVARLNVDGSVDTTFTPGIGTFNPELFSTEPVHAIAVQPNGQILIGGSFTYYNLVNYNGLTRLNPDGTLDLTFQSGTGTQNPVTGVADTVNTIVLDSNGNIVIGGNFVAYNQTRRYGLARVFPDGSLDTSFMDTAYNQFAGVPNLYFNANYVSPVYPFYNSRNAVYAIALENAPFITASNIIIGGTFEAVGGGLTRDDIRARSNVARVIGGSTIGPGNIEMMNTSYSVNNSDGSLYVSLVRTNGLLGSISATFDVTTAAPGPGIATAGTDFAPSVFNPTWVTTYSQSANAIWMVEWGEYGPNFNEIPNVNPISAAAGVTVNVFNPGNISGNLSANFGLSAPTTSFTLGGEYIPLGAALGAQTAAPLTIIDSNIKSGTVGFSSPTYSVIENGSSATITVTRTNGSTGNITVFYATTDGSATNGADYTGVTNSVVLSDGMTNATFTVATKGHYTSVQPDKTVNLRLFSPSAGSLGLTNAILTLINPNYAPGHISFSATNYPVSENAGSAAITVNRLGGSATTLGVTFVIRDGTAINHANYNYVGTTNLFWNSLDATSRTILIPVLDDGLVTPNLTASLVLTNSQVNGTNNPEPLAFGGTNSTLTINNADAAGIFQFSAASYSVKKYAGYALIPVTRTGGSVGTATVNFTTLDDTALAGTDYTTVTNTLTFTNGQLSQLLYIPILSTTNGLRDLFVQLVTNGLATTAALGVPSKATLYIIDSDTVNEPPGSGDTTYSPFAGLNGNVYALQLQANNQLLIGGDFTMANGVPRNRIARLNDDGTLDASFSLPSDSYGANAAIRSIALQADGRILLGGAFTNFNGVSRSYVARLNADGTLDSLFNPGSGADNPVYAVAPTTVNGSPMVMLGGSFASVNGTTFNGVGRLNSDGTPDTTFNPGGLGANATVYALAVQSDGKIIIGGDFTTYNGVPSFNHIARLNVNGSVDTNFLVSALGANNSVRTIALQLDGRILIGGLFTSVNGVTLNHIARLNADGTVDTTFNSGLGANDAVFSIALQRDTRIMVGGEFTTCSGVTRNRVTRLNPDGTVDPSINFGTGANDFVAAIAIQQDTIQGYPTNVPDEKIILGGGFTQYNSQTNNHLVRIFGGAIGGSGAFQFSSANYQVDELGTNALITVLRTGGTTNGPAGDIKITAYTSNGSAVAGINYLSISTNLDFPLGEVVKSFVVPVLPDGVVTPPLTVNLAITNPTAPAAIGNQPTAVLTIVNDDSTMSFSASTYQVPKNIVSGVAAINIIRNGGTNATATVFFSTSGGSATPVTDYTPVNETLTFAPGVTNVVVNVPINNNGVPEGNQTVAMQLTSATGTTLIAPTNAVLTIIDTVNAPGDLSFVSPSYSIIEGGGVGTTNIYVTIQRTFGSSGTVSVGYSTQDGTATAGSKYVPTNGVVSFADGETNKTISVPVINTSTAEGPETFSIYLFNPSGGASLLAPTNTVVTILNTNTGIAFGSATYAFTEPSGTVNQTVLLNVIRFNNTNGTTTVTYSTTNGTAVSPINFLAVVNGTVTFNPGDSVKSIAITTVHDPAVTGDLTFTVGLANPSGGAQLTTPTYAVVTDHDADAGIFLLTNSTSVYRNSGSVPIYVICSNTNVEPVSVNYATGGGTAVPGTDYTATSGTLTFTNGTFINVISVPILLNNSVQSNRTFNVTLSSPTPPGVLLPPTTETVTIVGTNTPSGLSYSTPIIISGFWGTTNADNTLSVPESGDPLIAGFAPNAPVWFEWTAPPGGDGEVTLDTIGSQTATGLKLDTVMAVFTGANLGSLNQLAANDDLYPTISYGNLSSLGQVNQDAQSIFNTNASIVSISGASIVNNQIVFTLTTNFIGEYNYSTYSLVQPFSGPSGLRFNAKAGSTYFIAVDTKGNSGLIVSNGVFVLGSNGRGPVRLSWAYHPAGVFRFASENVEQTGVVQTNGNPFLLYKCAETEGGGISGIINSTHGEIGPFSSANEEETLFHAYYTYDVQGLLVTVTRVAGSSGRVSVDYATVDGNTNLIINGDIPAVSNIDYTPVQGTLIFNDFEMSKTIVIPIIDRNPFDTGGLGVFGGAFPLQNRDFTVQLSNPRRDLDESEIVSDPRVDPVFGQVLCRILSTSIDPKGPSTFSQLVTNISLTGVTNIFTNTIIADQLGHLLNPTNALFNFGKANYRFVRDASSYWGNTPMTVYVNRRGTNTSSVTLHYRFNSEFLDQNGPDDENNEFPLQPGSDYATPTPPTIAGILGTNSDFAGVGSDSGTITFPGGDNNTFQSQPIHFNIQNNRLTEFNKDIHISLYEVGPHNITQPDGMVAECTATILFDDTAPPAGSVDELYNPDYASDLAFVTNSLTQNTTVPNPGTDPAGNVYGVVLTTNNQAIIGGAFATYTDSTNTYKVNGIARLNPDGSLDPTFNVVSGKIASGVSVVPAGEFIDSLAIVSTNIIDLFNNVTNVVQSSLVIGGNFSSYDGNRRNGIARLNLDGTLDSTFNPGAGANGTVWSILAQPDGRIIIGGDFTTYNGSTANHIARLNLDGSLDVTFNSSNLITGPVYAMAMTPGSTSLVIGGNFKVTGQFYQNIARLNSNGSLDNSFNPGTGPNGSVLSLAWQFGTNIVVGGSFKTVSGASYNNLVRLNFDGSIDGAFFDTAGSDNSVNSITVDPASNLVYIGGPFTEVNGTHRLGFARLNTDGTVDTSFLDTAYNQFAGLPRIFYGDAPGAVYASALQADGSVIIGGSFQQVGGGQADKNVRAVLEAEEGLAPSTTNADLLVSEGNTQLEPKTRDGLRNHSNLARLIGGSTTGPGNIGMVSTSYAVNKSQVTAPVTLTRANGSIGYALANFAVLPGLAHSGADYQYDALPPIYPISWEFEGPTRMHSDGEFGANGLMQDIYGQRIKYGVNGPASVNVTIINNTSSSGNLNAQFQMANPSQQDLFYLGGQDIPVGIALGISQAPLTLVDNSHQDGVFSFASSSYIGTNSPLVVGITRTNGSFGSVQLSYRTTTNGSTAVANTDYWPTNGVVTFASSQTSGSFPFTILNNSSVSAQEKDVNVQLYNIQDLSGGTAQLGLTNAVVRIVNPNFSGYLNFTTNAYFGLLPSGMVNFTVSRTVGSKGTLTVQYGTYDFPPVPFSPLHATNKLDYIGSTNTLTWNNGDVSPRTVSIPLLNTTSVGTGNKLFLVSLFNATLNGVGMPSLMGSVSNATLEIVNQNNNGTFQFSSSSYQFNENGGYATITVTRTGSTAGQVQVACSTVDGTAFAGTNYVAVSTNLTFQPSDVIKSFSVPLLDDHKTNPPPASFDFGVGLAVLTPNAVPGAPTNALVHIVDAESYNEGPGTPDTSFNASLNGSVHSLALQSNGQIVAGGSFTVADNVSINRIARFNPDGTLDGGFMTGLAGADGTVNAVLSQTDNRIVVGGAFANVDGTTCQGLARLMTNGILDTSFNYNSGADNTVFALAEAFVNGSREIYVGGAFSTYASASSPGIVRLYNNGLVDSTFSVGGGANGTVYAVAAYPTNSVGNAGKVLVGGQFTNFNGFAVANLVRLNSDGSLDTNFNQTASVSSAVRAIAVQPDDRIVIGGDFTNVNAVVVGHIARLNSNGTLDTAFTTAATPGINGTVDAIALQADNRIMLGGQFSSDNGVTRANITRLMPSGAVDPSINFGTGANGSIDAVVVQPTDGSSVIGGDFTQYDGQEHDYIARIFGGSETGSGAFQFSSANYQIDETGQFATITILRTGGTSGTNADGSGDVFVAFSTTTNGTAKAGVNYVPATNYVDFPPGEVSENVHVQVTEDLVVTPNLTVPLMLSNPTPGTSLGDQANAILTIINDDSQVVFDNAAPTVAKNTPTGFANIVIDRIGSTSGTCSVNFFTGTNGTAVIGTDYFPTNAIITFNPGDTNEIIQVAITNNLLVEGPRTVAMTLTNGVNTAVGSPSNSVLTILDTVVAPGNLFFAATNFNAVSSSGLATLIVQRSGGTSGDATVTFTTVPGTAVPGLNYFTTTGTVTLHDGVSSNSFTIPLNNTTVPQGPVSFTVQLSNPSPAGVGLISPTNATVTIINTNPVISFTLGTNTVSENAGLANIVVQRQNNTSVSSSVHYATTDGTALAGINYSNTTGTLTFGVGETLKSISVPLLNHSNLTALTFGMNLSSPVNAQLIVPSNTVVILNGAAAGVSFTTNATSVLNNAGSVLITVVCSNPGVEPVVLNSNIVPLEVSYTTVDGSAKAGINYNHVSGTIIFTNGLGTNTFSVPILNPQTVTSNLSFSVILTNVTTPGYISPYGTNVVTIDESGSGVRFSQSSYSVFKNAGVATINVYRTGFTDSVVSVNYTATNGTAISGQNFYPTNGTLVFTNGVTSQAFNVQLIANTQVQPNLFALLQLSSPTNAQIVQPGAATLTILENGGSYVIPAGSQLVTNSSVTDLNLGVIGSNDTVQVLFAFRDSAGLNVTNLVAYLLATNGVSAPSPASQSYGSLTVYGHSVSRAFSFTAKGTNSYTISPTFMLYDNGTFIGPATFTFTLGTWTTTYANPSTIIMNDNTTGSAAGTPASLYPSLINVTGAGTYLVKATVTLTNVSHAALSDISALVVSPTTNTLLMAHEGGNGQVTHITLTFDDAATNALSPNVVPVTSTNKPSQSYPVINFP